MVHALCLLIYVTCTGHSRRLPTFGNGWHRQRRFSDGFAQHDDAADSMLQSLAEAHKLKGRFAHSTAFVPLGFATKHTRVADVNKVLMHPAPPPRASPQHRLTPRTHGAKSETEATSEWPPSGQNVVKPLHQFDRRALLMQAAAAGGVFAAPDAARATISKDADWPLWLALPVAPYSRRKTVRREVAAGIWTFDQLIGIYYVHVPIRMTVVAMDTGGLFVYAPVAPTRECLNLLQPLIDQHGPVKYIVLPSVAVEHKVLAGPFARNFPGAEFYVTDKQYSFPVNLPDVTLGLPRWAKLLPASSQGLDLWGGEFEHEVLTVKPGPGSMYQDAAFFHKPSKTLLLCDALFATTAEPPPILTSDAEYTRALLFHARDSPLEVVADTPEARRKGWRRIVLLFNFFFPGAAIADLGLKPLLALSPTYEFGWGGWLPFSWRDPESELKAFEAFSGNGKPTILPIIQIILSRGDSGKATLEWVDKVKHWDFERVVPAHLDAPLAIGPQEFAETYNYIRKGKNEVRFCDEDVAFLRKAEEGVLSFSVYKSALGVLRGRPCGFV